MVYRLHYLGKPGILVKEQHSLGGLLTVSEGMSRAIVVVHGVETVPKSLHLILKQEAETKRLGLARFLKSQSLPSVTYFIQQGHTF